MDGLGFWDIYWPVLAALISSVVVFEAFQLGLSYYITKNQMRKYAEFQEKVQSGEIEVTPEMLESMMPGVGAPPFDLRPTTISGGHGQYL